MSSIDCIEKLIALSGSTNEEEARSAAFIACKLIRENCVRLVAAETIADPWKVHFAPWVAQPAPARPRPPHPRPSWTVPVDP